MPFDQFIDPPPSPAEKLTQDMSADEYLDFINEQSFPCSDPPPAYYGGYRKACDDLAP